jgi:Swt1-like HEPN
VNWVSRRDLESWLFQAVASEDLLDNLEREGSAIRAPSDPRAVQRVIPLDEFSPDLRRRAMHALPAYLAFFCVENAVREIVSDRLSEEYGAEWWDTAAATALKNKVRERQEKEGRNRWHISRGDHQIYYTDFGDLKSLLQSHWTHFEDLFPDQNWIIARLDELEASRNIIAHSNVLDDRELGRIQLYLQDWLRQVG